MDNKKLIGQRINNALAVRQMKQKELAAAIGVTDNTISYFCSGSRTPNLQLLVAMAKELDVSTDYLLGLVDIDNSTPDQRLSMVSEYIGLGNTAVEKLRSFARSDSVIINAILESPHFQKIVQYISKSVQYAPSRGNLIAKNILDGLKGIDSPFPAEDMDNLFKFGATDAASKLYDEVSADLYDKVTNNGKH